MLPDYHQRDERGNTNIDLKFYRIHPNQILHNNPDS